MQQFDAIWRRLGDLASAGGWAAVGDSISIRVVTSLGQGADQHRHHQPARPLAPMAKSSVYASGVGA